MLEVRNLKKTYKTKGGVEVHALDDVSIVYPEKGLVFLLGKSGSGKSTLLNVTGGLDKPDSGEIIVKGRSSKEFTTSDFDSYRNTFIGFIFQEYNILNEFNVEQNIALALQLQGKKASKDAVNDILKQVDLEGLNKRKPNTLSGGQKQRIAIARALIKSPEIIMADEPTGALDSNTGKQVFDTLKKLSQDKLIIVVSHDRDFAEQYGDRIIELKDGKIISDDSKNYKEPVKVSENVHVINDNTITIKNADKLTDADMKHIAKVLKGNKGEVVITSGDKNVLKTKQAIHVNDDGASEVFLPTVEQKDQKKYTAEEAKFIKSKMPFKSSFKMGASGLKTKPVRLVFTILLSIVSFTMFGVLSTFMLYNPSYTIANALQKSPNDYEQIVKNADYIDHSESRNFKTDEVLNQSTREYSERVRFGASEIDAMNNNSVGHKFAGVISFSSYSRGSVAASLQVSTGDDLYYNFVYLNGFVDAGEAYMNSNNFTLTGTYPTKPTELAISEYTFHVLKHNSELGLTNEVSSIIGKEIDLYMNGSRLSENVKMKVTGVYNVGQIPSKFDDLKDDNKYSQLDKTAQKNLTEGFANYIGKSYHVLGYVSSDFYSTYFDKYYSEYKSADISSTYLRGIAYSTNDSVYQDNINEDMGYRFYIDKDQQGMFDGFTFYDNAGNKTTKAALADDEIYLPYFFYQMAFSDSIGRYYNNARECMQYGSVYPEIDDYLNETQVIEEVSHSNRNLLENAIDRIINYYNGGSKSTYPEGHTLEEDTTFVKNFSDTYYQKATRRNYIYNDVGNRIYNVVDREDPERANFVNAYRVIMNDGIKTDESFANLDNAIKADSVVKALADKAAVFDSAESARNDYSLTKEVRERIENIIMGRWWGDLSDDEVNNLKDILSGIGDSGKYVIEYNSDASRFVNSSTFKPVTTAYFKNYVGRTGELKVKGFFHQGETYNREMSSDEYIVTKSFALNYTKYEETVYSSYRTTSYVKPIDEKYFNAITLTRYTEDQISNLRAKGNGYSYELTNYAFNEVVTFITLVDILKTAFLITGLVVGGFAALMFANFITVSISNKKKEIGILRAVGARGNDVFKIFYSESFLIAAICVVVSIISSAFTCIGLNSTLQNSTIGVTALNFGVINVLFIIGVALVVSIVSTFIPVFLASRKPPVESIRAL